MALYPPYKLVDDDTVAVHSNHISIEGSDVLVMKIKDEEKTTRVEDYLGIGNPMIYR